MYDAEPDDKIGELIALNNTCLEYLLGYFLFFSSWLVKMYCCNKYVYFNHDLALVQAFIYQVR